MIKKTNGCYIGCRVSSSKQAQQGESLIDQQRVCELTASNIPSQVIKIYSDQHSATKEGDSFIDDIVDDIKKQPIKGSYFIIKSIDRFCRAGTTEYKRLKDCLEDLGIQLVDSLGLIRPKVNTLEHLGGVKYKWSMVSPSEGAEIMEAHKSNREVTDILTRMIGAEINLVREGYKVRRSDDGFINKRVFVEGKKKVIQEPDPERAPYFVKMFEMSVTNTDKEVVDYVNSMGYRSREQKIWNKDKTRIIGTKGGIPLTVKQLQTIRQRPIYAGINTERWLTEPRRTEYKGLIEVDLFNKANKGKVYIEEKENGKIIIHRDYNPHKLKRTKDNPNFPHKSVILCPECGKPFLGSSSRGKLGGVFPSYHCTRNHKRIGIPKKEFEEKLTDFISKLQYKDKGFMKAFEATLMNKYREKEKELGEFSTRVGTSVIQLEAEKKQAIETFTSTKNEIIRKELEKKIEEIHSQIEKMREQRNGLEVRENDVHSFVRYVKYLMEHPVEMLVKQKNLPALKSLFGLVFDELPMYTEIVNGTPKLSLPFKLKDEFEINKSLCVTLPGIEPGLPA